MANLTKEFYNVQNPALSAYLISNFSLGYYKENQETVPMPLLFIVLPIIFKQEIVKFITSTQKRSGLRIFADKFIMSKNSKNDLIIQLHNSSNSYKNLTLEAIRIGITANLIVIQDDARILPLEKNIKSYKLKSNEVKSMKKAAEKLGTWCSRLSLMEISQILKVRF